MFLRYSTGVMFMYLRKVRLYKMDNEITRADNKFAEYVMELDYSSIGSSVYAGNTVLVCYRTSWQSAAGLLEGRMS